MLTVVYLLNHVAVAYDSASRSSAELQDLLEKEVKRSWDEDAAIILADVDKALQGTVGQA